MNKEHSSPQNFAVVTNALQWTLLCTHAYIPQSIWVLNQEITVKLYEKFLTSYCDPKTAGSLSAVSFYPEKQCLET